MKYILPIAVLILGLYIMVWAFQAAWISITPVINPEIYKTRALFLFPMSLILIIQSIILYIYLIRRK